MLYTLMMIDSFLNEDFDKVTFIANQKHIFVVDLEKAIKLDNDKIILMKMILILLFMSDFWLGVVKLKNTKHLKKKR